MNKRPEFGSADKTMNGGFWVVASRRNGGFPRFVLATGDVEKPVVAAIASVFRRRATYLAAIDDPILLIVENAQDTDKENVRRDGSSGQIACGGHHFHRRASG